jgi:hypothetical protein
VSGLLGLPFNWRGHKLAANCGVVLTMIGAVEKLMVVLRDGRKLMGVLRSWDQYGLSPDHGAERWGGSGGGEDK